MTLHLSSKTERSTPASEQDLAINTVDTCNSLNSSHAQTLSGEPKESQQCSPSDAAYLIKNEMLASNSSSEVQQEDVELTALRSFETHVDRRRQRLAANAKRAAFERAKESEQERSLRLAALAKKARLKRSAESEEEKLIRLAKNAERERARRLAVKEQSKITKSDENKQKSSQKSSVQHGHGEGLHSQLPSTSRAYVSEALDIQQSPLSHYCEAASAAALIEDQLMSDPNRQNREKSSDEDPRTSVILSYGVEEYHGESERLTTTELLCTTIQPGCRKPEQNDYEHQSRLAFDARQAASRRSNKTEHERKLRLASLAERVKLKRSLENEQKRSERLANDAKRARTRRVLEVERRLNASSADVRRTQNPLESDQRQNNHEVLSHHNENENELREEENTQMNSVESTVHLRRRTPANLGIALTMNVTEENYLGRLNVRCAHCGALYFPGEGTSVNGRFNVCCNFGNVSLNLFSDFPELFRSFYLGSSQLCKNFRTHIRSFNSALAMASMGAQVETPRGYGPYCYRIHGQVYHYVGPITPEPGVRRQFGQVYILDTDAAAAERSGNPVNAQCDATVMQQLTSWLHSNNSYAASLKMMGDIAAEEERRALRENRQVPTIRMVFEDARNVDHRRYNVPIANEIAVVYVGEDDDVPANRSFAIHHKGGRLQIIRDIDACCDPLTYPLLFPRGGQGWHVDLKKNPSTRIRTRISQREYYSNMLAVRHSFNPLHHAGKLMQQFVVDAYVKIEQNRLNYTRTHQKELRIDSYKGLTDHLASDGVDGPPGQRIILPSSFRGSPRAMHQSYQDAMAIVARYGKPDYFLTFTCNPQWREIAENLYPSQSASDRPDLVARVFHQKLEVLQKYLFEKKILGCVAAYVGIVEWQKRGLPHCHMLLIMAADAKPRTPEAVNAAVQAYLPSDSEDPRLLSIVARNMIHRRCGATNLTAPCMVNGECSKRYPKEFRETTDIDVDGYPKYKRPDDGRTVTSGVEVYDNRHVLPYNRFLLLLLNAHINLEICGYIHAVKYLYKYVYKGPDRASLRLLQQGQAQRTDEIRAHLDARYMCSPEALHHIFMFECQYKSAAVYRLAVHLPDFQSVTFRSGEEREAAVREATRDSMLTAWFKLNEEYDLMESENRVSGLLDPRTLYYHQLPEHFTFGKERKWNRRKRGSCQIGRMYMVTPTDPERFSLRILLLNRKNMRSFEDLRTVEGNVHPTFLDAARALGLLHDDSHYESCLEEAVHFQMPAELRALFTYMLAFCEMSDPRHLYDRFKSYMAEDFIHKGYTVADAEALAYFELYDKLQLLRYDLSVIVTPPSQSRPVLVDHTDYAFHERKGSEMYENLNEQQRSTADDILASFENNRSKLHFVDGPGGSGKTYLYNAIYHILKGQHRHVLCVAWTGIAANLLPEGRTAHSTFKLNIKSGNRQCSLRREDKDAIPLKEADVIIWDEVSMVSKSSLEAIDLFLQDLMCNEAFFGGKTVVLGGDFRQVLPIVERGSEGDMIDACVKNSDLWRRFTMHRLSVNIRAAESGSTWCDLLMRIGNGEVEEDEMGRIELPAEILSKGDLISEVFGDSLTDFHTLSERAILAPRNIEAYRINEEALGKLPGRIYEYKSVDDVISDEPQNEYTTEFLNSLAPAGMPPHNLRMKEGSIVMLLRNLDIRNGLCNGTRLIVTHFGRFILGCRFASGDRKGKLVLIPRIDNYTDIGVPFRLRRRQFPVRLSFAMTINKAQGQTFTSVGISLETEVFSHGQLYVALSRGRRMEGIRVHKKEERVKNVVIRAVLN